MRKIKISLKNQARTRMLRNQLSSLVIYGEIQTTLVKAKFLKKEADGFFSKLKGLSALEKAKLSNKFLYGSAVKKAVDEKYGSIKILKIGKRIGDNADVARIIVEIEKSANKEKPAVASSDTNKKIVKEKK